MKKLPTSVLVLGLMASFLPSLGRAEEPVDEQATPVPPVAEIVDRANRVAYYQGKDGRAQVAMEITDSQGRSRSRVLVILRKDDSEDPEAAGDQKFYVYFLRPADVNKMVFLVWKYVERGKDDDRWLYLPALDLVKRIAGAEKRTSFVGSDFFYEDVSGRGIEEDTHELERTTDDYYVVKSTPRDPGAVEFAYYTNWIHRESFIPVRTEYFDKNGEKYREYTALGVETIEGYPTVTRSSMKSLKTGSKTVMSYTKVAYDIGLPDGIFTERYLRNPPREYLR
ncbi:MAG: outer membrane lipoprotein-sorting protein [Candidatus Erginobacter occultus]|nr:outer membrane lipoprotein-sorting protein [Candidatus Erginobacter occultus]